MKVNNECIKAVLNYVIENTDIIDGDTKCSIKQTNLYEVIKGLEENYERKLIIHSTFYASKCGYLEMEPIRETRNIVYSNCNINDVTPIGYKFLEENN